MLLPDHPPAQTPISGPDDLRRIEAEPYGRFMPHARVLDALEAVAARQPGRPALTALASADLAAPPRRWTYAELVAAVRRAARLFAALAGDATPRVALLLPPMPEAHAALWGAEAAGIACPINFQLNAEHVAALVEACGAQVVVALGPASDVDVWSRAEGLASRCPSVRHVLAVPADRPLPAGVRDFVRECAACDDAPHDLPGPAPATDLAALFHTGGTTGAPKLAQHTHRNQLHAAWGAARMFGTTPDDVLFNGFPLFHVAGAFVYGLSTLLAGGHVLLSTRPGLRDPAVMARFGEIVHHHRVTLVAAVPTVMAALLASPQARAPFAEVRAVLTGGSPLPDELARAFEDRFGTPVRNILGMTETAGVIAIEPCAAARVPGSCGWPLPFTEVRIVRTDGASAAPGESGILQVRGPNVSPGYTDAARDAGTFEGGWLVSGDIAHRDADGRIVLTGRAKDVIIRGSHNIDPGLVESALLRHPEVEMAAAVGQPDAYAGEVPVAYVSLKPGSTATAEQLLAHATPHIAERPAVPRRVEVLPSLPTTAVGKVYRPALRLRATAHALQALLADGDLDARVGVEVTEASRGIVVRFRLRDLADAARVRALMRPFAIAYDIDEPTP